MVVRAHTQDPPEDIPQRVLRNESARVLRDVEGGKRFRISVSGRPVADLVPVPKRDRDVPMAVVGEFIRDARERLDPDFWFDARSYRSSRSLDAWERYRQRDT